MTRLDVNFFDYGILFVYFALVVAIGLLARRAIATMATDWSAARTTAPRAVAASATNPGPLPTSSTRVPDRTDTASSSASMLPCVRLPIDTA